MNRLAAALSALALAGTAAAWDQAAAHAAVLTLVCGGAILKVQIFFESAFYRKRGLQNQYARIRGAQASR
jgi:hypothetical protein